MVNSKWLGVFFVAGLLLVWEVAAGSLLQLTAFPPVSDILLVWGKVLVSGELLREVAPSLGRIFTGYILATLLGIGIGTLMGLSSGPTTCWSH